MKRHKSMAAAYQQVRLRHRGAGQAARPKGLAASLQRLAVCAATASLALAVNGMAARAADPTWLVNTVAGTGVFGYSGDGGPAVNAELGGPTGVADDTTGNIYFADRGNGRIRKVSITGTITTIAGSGAYGFNGDGGPATNASLANPGGVVVDATGNVYFADESNQRVRKVDTTGIISTVAGTGQAGFSGDGGQATSAMLSAPYGLALDAAGDLYIADSGNSRIRKVSASGVISTIAGNGVAGFSGDGGLATSAELSGARTVAVTSTGSIYVADNRNNRVRRVNSSGVIATVAGNGNGGCAQQGVTTAVPIYVSGIALDSSGNLYVASCNQIQMVDTNGMMTIAAGNGSPTFNGDGNQAINTSISPSDLAIATSGTIFFADGSDRVREIHAPLVGDNVLIPVPGESVTIPGLPVPVFGNIYASPDGLGGYTVIITVDGTTLPSVTVFDDNLEQGTINTQVGGPTSPFTVGVAGFTLTVPVSVDAFIAGQQICLLNVGGTCLAPVPVDQSNPTSGEVLAVQVCVQGTPVGCVTREIPF